MKFNPITRFGLCTLLLYTWSFGLAGEALSKEHSQKLSFEQRFLRTEAVQNSINVISTFALRFSAAIRATSLAQQEALVQEVLQLFTHNFQITVTLGSTTITANDYNSLLNLVQLLATGVTFDSSLIGDFSVEKYHIDKHGHRTVQLAALQYVYQTLTTGMSNALVNLDDYVVVETKCDDFKIKSLTATVLTIIPLNSGLGSFPAQK